MSPFKTPAPERCWPWPACWAPRRPGPPITIRSCWCTAFSASGPTPIPGSSFLYWGGYHDIAARMQLYKGPHAVYTAGVGAISSNWDRAAELYAQIKGGCVDYGATHVARYGYPGQARQPAGKCWAADPPTTRTTIPSPSTRNGMRRTRST
jgi:hypothetical protein